VKKSTFDILLVAGITSCYMDERRRQL